MKKYTITIIIVIILICVGAFFLFRSWSQNSAQNQNSAMTASTTSGQSGQPQFVATSTMNSETPGQSVIGSSVQGRDIVAYHFGTGSTELLFVGGIHGGYEWNTALVAYQLIGYLQKDPSAIPANIRVTVIPVLNPDGLDKIVGTTTGNFTQADVPATLADTIPGRFNANGVDLNRNFDCDWQATGTWQNTPVSGGTAAFSEPESQAVENYVNANKPAAVVVWYSAAGGVYSSSCDNGVSAETKTITQKYAAASGYPAYDSFNVYATTGDLTNWLAKSDIPAISVLLTNHTATEWAKNQAGVQALLTYYANK